MTSVETKWMSIRLPEQFHASVNRADILIDCSTTGIRTRVAALRKDPPFQMTDSDAKDFAAGGDERNPWTYEERSLGDHHGFFSSRSSERHFFSTVIGHTLILLSCEGGKRNKAESTIELVLSGLTINQSDG